MPPAPLMVSPAGAALYVPPPVPVWVTAMVPATLLQYDGKGYEIEATGAGDIVSTIELAAPDPQRLEGVTINVPPVAPAANVIAFEGADVVALKVAPVPE